MFWRSVFDFNEGRKKSSEIIVKWELSNKSEIFLDVGRRDGKGSRSGQIDLKAETNSVLSFRVSD